MRANTGTAVVAAAGKRGKAGDEPAFDLQPVGRREAEFERAVPMLAPSGFTDPYRAAEVRVTSAAGSVPARGVIGATVNDTGALDPVGFAERAGLPRDRDVFAPWQAVELPGLEIHSPAATSAVADATGGPPAAARGWISTVTGAVGRAPEKEGALLADGDERAGQRHDRRARVHGERDGRALACRLPIELCWVATAV